MRPAQSLSDLMQDLKSGSSKWINERRLTKEKFEWQSGYGGFSYSKSHIRSVIKYIENQEVHHRKINLVEEYKMFLDKFCIEYDERYILRLPE
jgi:hypothetical protein